MRRLLCIVFNALAAASMLLFTTTLVLWAARVEASFGEWPWCPSFRPDGLDFSYAPDNHDYWSWRAPYWKLMLLELVLPAMWVRSTLNSRRRRGRRGFCRECGYDLRATPDRCPECGSIAKT